MDRNRRVGGSAGTTCCRLAVLATGRFTQLLRSTSAGGEPTGDNTHPRRRIFSADGTTHPTCWIPIVYVLLLVTSIGCRRIEPEARVNPTPPPSTPVAKSTDAAESADADQSIEAFEDTFPPVAAAPPEPKYVWGDEADRERVVLLTPGGPLVMDVWISIAGRPHREAVDELIDTALAAGDTNGDGRKTWKEWRENVEFFSQVLPDATPTRQQLDMWIETYDQNRNRHIERQEMAAWLGRDAGRSVAPLSLRSSRSRGYGSNNDSRLGDLLDVDQSGGLSLAEIEQASDALWMLDANDDRMLVDAELTPLEEQLAGNQATMVRATRVTQRHAALHFGPHFDVGRLGYLLADMYAPRAGLSAESFADLPSLFDELDDTPVGGDQWLGDDDIARVTTIEPHVRLALSFEAFEDALPHIAQLELSSRVERLEVAVRPSDARVVLTLGASRIVVSVHDLAGVAATPADNLRRSQTQLMVHNECDVLFEYLDANSDGRLGEREVATAGEQLATCDHSGDGLLTSNELPYTMIVAFLRGENPAARDFYVPQPPATPPRRTDAPDWFVAGDFNGDGDLGRREFLGSREAFDAFDSNHDGFIDAVEATAADK